MWRRTLLLVLIVRCLGSSAVHLRVCGWHVNVVCGNSGCMDACTVNSFGVRGGSAGAVAAYNTGMATDAFTWSNVTSLASAMMTTYKSARSSLDNPTMSVGLSDGSYVEIVSCRYYG